MPGRKPTEDGLEAHFCYGAWVGTPCEQRPRTHGNCPSLPHPSIDWCLFLPAIHSQAPTIDSVKNNENAGNFGAAQSSAHRACTCVLHLCAWASIPLDTACVLPLHLSEMRLASFPQTFPPCASSLGLHRVLYSPYGAVSCTPRPCPVSASHVVFPSLLGMHTQALLHSYNIDVDREAELRERLENTAQRVGLRLTPDGPSPYQ